MPLGRAIVLTSCGTVVGSLAGALAAWTGGRMHGDDGVLDLVGGAVAGLLLSAAALWWAQRRSQRAA